LIAVRLILHAGLKHHADLLQQGVGNLPPAHTITASLRDVDDLSSSLSVTRSGLILVGST